MSMPAGAQLSDDGNYWWDGADWQPVQAGDGSGGIEYGTRSDDGNYWWDGSDWQPAEGDQAAAGEDQEFDFEPDWVPTIMEMAGYAPDESGAKDYLAALGADEAVLTGDAIA
jgi:hypothetical protein